MSVPLERRAATLAAGGLCLFLVACGPWKALKDTIGFGQEREKEPKREKVVTEAPFPSYLLQAFPEAKTVRLDPQSPRISLAAEAILTRDDPHRRRGPPRFSPDGRLVAYEEAERNGEERWIVIRRLDGVLVRRIPLSPSTAARMGQGDWTQAISWAPSSDAFVYTRETTLGAFEAVLCDLAGEPRRIAGPPAFDGSAQWSPSGDRVAYLPATRPGEIWSADISSRKATLMVDAGSPVHSYSFSADGRRLTYSAGREERDVWTADVATDGTGSGQDRVIRWPFDDVLPAFSPDGRWIAFYSTFRPPGATQSARSLLVISADGTDAPSGAALMDRVLAPKVSTRSVLGPSWSPDARWIAFVEPRTEDYRALVLVEPASRDRHELNPNSITNEDASVSADGVLAYRAHQDWWDHIVIGLVARGATRTER